MTSGHIEDDFSIFLNLQHAEGYEFVQGIRVGESKYLLIFRLRRND